jgi:all-trans-retinol 13,14-reductase
MKYDVIIIGSGIGGLTAALTCACNGRDVLLLEAAQEFGGFINPFSRKGFWFDVGIHYVGGCAPGQVLHQHFERLGLLGEVSFRQLSPDGFDRYSFPDYEVRMCKGIHAYRDRLIADFPHEADGLRRFFSLVKEISDVMDAGARTAGVGSKLRLLRRLPTLMRYRSATFADVLDKFVGDRRLRAVLAGAGVVGLPPSKASGLLMTAAIAHYVAGAYFPVGGQKAVRDAYVNALKRYGATLRRNSPVAQILVERGVIAGVRTAEGKEYRAAVVISNADATITYGRLIDCDRLPRKLRRQVAGTVPSLGSLCVFIGTDAEVCPEAHGLGDANVWSYPSYDIDALYQPVLDGEFSDQSPFFMTLPTFKDPSGSHAPAGKHTVELFTVAPYSIFAQWAGSNAMERHADYVALKTQLGDRLVRRAERYLPGLSRHIEVKEVATPLTNISFVNTPVGSIYGPAHTPTQVGRGRYRTHGPVHGLYLCGSSVMGAGIPSCVASGVMAAQASLAQKRPLRLWLRS